MRTHQVYRRVRLARRCASRCLKQPIVVAAEWVHQPSHRLVDTNHGRGVREGLRAPEAEALAKLEDAVEIREQPLRVDHWEWGRRERAIREALRGQAAAADGQERVCGTTSILGAPRSFVSSTQTFGAVLQML